MTLSKYCLLKVLVAFCALSIITTTANAANPADDYATGLNYFQQQNYRDALAYFSKAAKQGNSLGQGMLCSMYYYGTGTEQNFQTATYWCEKSAMQGDAMAQYDLGNAYISGKGVRADFQKGISWLLASAKSGHPPAYFNLGVHYYKGQVVAQNYVESYKWFRLAKMNGLNEGEKWTRVLEGKMSSNQVAEGKRLANDWVGQPRK